MPLIHSETVAEDCCTHCKDKDICKEWSLKYKTCPKRLNQQCFDSFTSSNP